VTETATHRHEAEQGPSRIAWNLERMERAQEDAAQRKVDFDKLDNEVKILLKKKEVAELKLLNNAELNAREKKLLNAAKQAELNYKEVAKQAQEYREVTQRAKEEMLEHQALAKETLRQVDHNFERLWEMTASRTARLAEAGRAFLAAQRLRLAAEAYSEASTFPTRILKLNDCQPSEQLDRGAWVHWRAVWAETISKRTVKAARDAAHVQIRKNSLVAARCWLLAADVENFGSKQVSSEDAQKAALVCYRRTGHVPSAMICLTKTWDTKAIAIGLAYVVMFAEK